MYKATKEDIERAIRVIKEEMKKNNRIAEEDEIKRVAVEVMNTSYSIGGGYNESTIRKLFQSLVNKGYY